MDTLTDRLQQGSQYLVYTRDQLLALRSRNHAGKVYPIPEELVRHYRGSRAGALVKNVTLDSTLPAFHQFVSCPTRKNRTIDLMYANVRDAYKATPLPPPGKSDHNLVFLQPKYTPKVRRQPTTTRSFRNWSPVAEDALGDCFESTDWSVLQDSFGEDIEGGHTLHY